MLTINDAVAVAAFALAGIAAAFAWRWRRWAVDARAELDRHETLERDRPPPPSPDALFSDLVGAVQEAVLVHTDRILFANERSAELIGRPVAELVGKSLAELVAPEYAELVADNIRRRLAAEPAAERYEVEFADPHGQVSRLELAGKVVRYRGEPAVLFTAVEMVARGARGQERGRTQATLDSLGDGLVTTDTYGRIDYLNRAAELLLGRSLAEVGGKPFAEVVTVVDEAERKALADPVRQCLAAGVKVSLGRRAVMIARPDGAERSIELTAAPLLRPVDGPR